MGDTCDFGVEHLHAAGRVKHWDDSEGEEDYTHAAYPLHECSPDVQAVAEDFVGGIDDCSGGGESGDGFKEGVGDRHRCLAEYQRYHAEEGEYHPDGGCQKKSFTAAHARGSCLDAPCHDHTGEGS